MLSNCFLNDLTVNNRSLFNFYKKKTAWQFDVRSHVTEYLGDTRLFWYIRFADLKIRILKCQETNEYVLTQTLGPSIVYYNQNTNNFIVRVILKKKIKWYKQRHIYKNIYIIYTYERETSVCMCYAITVKQKIQRLFDEFSYSFNT